MTPLLLLACTSGGALDDSGGSSSSVDLLLVVDNSSSMVGATTEFGLQMEGFMSDWWGRELSGGVAMTSTTAEQSDGLGAAGALVGPILDPTAGDFLEDFRAQLFCELTLWDPADVPSDPDYDQTDPLEQVSQEYLDELCGFAGWENNEGSGTEEGLEGMLLAACRTLDELPEVCTHVMSPLSASDAGSNTGILRPGVTQVVGIITDEGDYSRQLGSGEEDPQVYLDAYEEMGLDATISVWGPAYDPGSGSLPCNTRGNSPWSVGRYQQAVEATGGTYVDILEEDGGDCVIGDGEGFWSALLDGVGEED